MADSIDHNSVKEIIIFLSDEKGVTQSAISKATGISYQTLRNIKAGRSSGNAEMIEKLRKAYPGLVGKENLSVYRDKYAEEFKEALGLLLENGISLGAIADKIGVNRQKLYNINAGRSSGDILMLNKIKEEYSELISASSDESENVSDFSSREKEMQAEIDRLKKRVEEKEDRIMKLIDLMYGDREESKDED